MTMIVSLYATRPFPSKPGWKRPLLLHVQSTFVGARPLDRERGRCTVRDVRKRGVSYWQILALSMLHYIVCSVSRWARASVKILAEQLVFGSEERGRVA